MVTDKVIEYDDKAPGGIVIKDQKEYYRRLALVRRQVAKTKGKDLDEAFRGSNRFSDGHVYSGEEIRVYCGLVADEEAQTAAFAAAVAEGTATGTLAIAAGPAAAAKFPPQHAKSIFCCVLRCFLNESAFDSKERKGHRNPGIWHISTDGEGTAGCRSPEAQGGWLHLLLQ